MDEESHDSSGRPYTSKIMISSITILLIACFVVVLFHAYARWFSRRRSLQLSISAASAAAIGAEGLDFRAMNSLPTFIYESSKSHNGDDDDEEEEGSLLECAVCLSEFEDKEKGRILPDCNHCFHVDCIDMWLLSHCFCPLCRARVRVQPPRTRMISP